MSRAFALQDLQGEHVGFLSLGFDPDGCNEGSGTIQVLPFKVEMFDSMLVKLLDRYRLLENGEHTVRLRKHQAVTRFMISAKSLPALEMELDEGGKGWLWQHPDLRNAIGRAVAAVKNT